MALTFRDYSADQVQAARSVLLELVHLLGEYRDDIVVVGGWVPQLILPPGPTPHVGSIDVFNSKLIVTTTPKLQQQIDQMLVRLREKPTTQPRPLSS